MPEDLLDESPEPSRDGGADPPTPLPDCKVWLIDGYNVLHASLGGQDRSEWWTARRRDELLARVSRFPGTATLWVVFDGSRPAAADPDEAASRLRIVFAASADEWIRQTLRAATEPQTFAVVTGDRPVADRARHRGAAVVSPRLFLSHCPPAE